MPAANPTPGTHHPGESLDLGSLIHSDWSGFYFSGYRLFLDGYRGQGYTAGDLRAQFYQLQEIHSLRIEVSRLRRDIEAAQAEQDRAEDRASWYRRQLILESRAGAMLSSLMA